MPPTPATSDGDLIIAEFQDRCAQLGLSLSNQQLERLLRFCDLLKEYNSHTNLVANADLRVVLRDHVLDCLSLMRVIQELNAGGEMSTALIDIGTGAGFPGLILALVDPSIKCTLVESTTKKCRFLEGVLEPLQARDQVQVICQRAEALAHEASVRGHFDLATSRAVGSLALVAELCLPFLRNGGTLLAQRSSRQVEEELDDQLRAFIEKLGGKIGAVTHLDPAVLGRNLAVVAIRKAKPTPGTYPRSMATIKRVARN